MTHRLLGIHPTLRLAVALTLVLTALGAQAATLQVHITHVETGQGDIRVAVCKADDFLSPKCGYDQSVPAKAGEVTVTFDHIPPGVYAIQAYDDKNGNGELDRNWIGWPKEGMGFSNNAPMHHGPPDYNDAAIRLSEPGGRVSFRMRYF